MKKYIKDWTEDIQLCSKFKAHRPALKMLEEFESIRGGYVSCIRVSKRQVDLFYKEVKLVHSGLCRAGPTVRIFAMAETN